jgi:hypothetical protein
VQFGNCSIEKRIIYELRGNRLTFVKEAKDACEKRGRQPRVLAKRVDDGTCGTGNVGLKSSKMLELIRSNKRPLPTLFYILFISLCLPESII